MAAIYRENVTDKEQTELENATFENSVPVMMNDKTLVVVRGNEGGAEKVQHAAGSRHSNAGVVMPDSSQPGKFQENTIGKA